MKFNYATSNVDRTTSLETRKASIKLNPTMVHVLSRDLYTKPVESLFREILINALDAHTKVGQTKPVEIKLPFYNDDTFYIRDFGPGIKHQELMDIYLSYGESTKRDNDEEYGAFGLGTKSPLAYTSSFLVRSVVCGEAREYLIYYDEDNIPCLDHRSTENTNDPSGLKVSLTTKNGGDYTHFVKAAETLLKRIEPEKYLLINKHIVEAANLEVEKGQRYKDLELKNGTGLSVTMGYYNCTINSKDVQNYLISKETKLVINNTIVKAADIISKLTSSYHIEIHSDIQGYPFHPSRERINVTPRTIARLCKDIEQGINELITKKAFNTFEDDIVINKLIGSTVISSENIPIKARCVEKSYSYYSSARIEQVISTYTGLVHRCSISQSSCISIVYLSETDMVDYLGGGRSNYTFPPEAPSNSLLVFLEVKDTTDPALLNRFRNTEELDLTNDIEKYRNRKRSVKNYVSGSTIARTVVRSMQDPKHNVLLLKASSLGKHKRDWESAQHNISTLKTLNKEIFWTPTKMGCLKNDLYIDILKEYIEIFYVIPYWKKPIILGLPATKGTKTIERTFKPLSELTKWIENFKDSDYYKRRLDIHSARNTLNIYLSPLEPQERAYGNIDWAHRIRSIAAKYSSRFTTNIEYEGDITKKASKIKDDILIKFPQASVSFNRNWYNHIDLLLKSDEYTNWVKLVAEKTNCKPTGAKSKNDPHYFS